MLAQRFPYEELHRDEQRTILFADLVDLADIRMIDAGGGSRFAPEALPRCFVVHPRRHHFQSHAALQPLVARCVDDAHPAFPDLARDRVVRDVGGNVIAKGCDAGVD